MPVYGRMQFMSSVVLVYNSFYSTLLLSALTVLLFMHTFYSKRMCYVLGSNDMHTQLTFCTWLLCHWLLSLKESQLSECWIQTNKMQIFRMASHVFEPCTGLWWHGSCAHAVAWLAGASSPSLYRPWHVSPCMIYHVTPDNQSSLFPLSPQPNDLWGLDLSCLFDAVKGTLKFFFKPCYVCVCSFSKTKFQLLALGSSRWQSCHFSGMLLVVDTDSVFYSLIPAL
jgi:hypothetical protein